MTPFERMRSGALYDAQEPSLAAARLHARALLRDLNSSRPDDIEHRAHLLRALIPNAGTELTIEPPFYCDYGANLYLGDRVFLNFNCTLLDVAPITIGHRTLLGPNVQLYTPLHPIDAEERAKGLEYARPITIGNDVWLGGGVIVCPGVTIGDRSVIGAGSVVTRDVPPDVFAAGNPCRVLRTLIPHA